MKIRDIIILASDLTSLKKVLVLVEELKPYISCFEVGVRLGANVGFPRAIKALKVKGVEVFVDAKVLDTKTYAAEAVGSLAKCGADIITLSCWGGAEMLRAAVEAVDHIRPRPMLIGVGPLTSQDYDDLVEIGIASKLNIRDPRELAETQNDFLRRLTRKHAFLAQESGLDGFVAPGDQIRVVREYCDSDFQIFATGVRPKWAPLGPHKRTITPSRAIIDTADRIIIGGPIINSPFGSSVIAAQKISKEIERALLEIKQL